MIEIDFIGGPFKGRQRYLRPYLTLGRAQENDVVLPSPAVSRQHAELRVEQTGFLVTNRSQQGVKLNGALLHSLSLADDESVLELGDVVMRVRRMAGASLEAEVSSNGPGMNGPRMEYPQRDDVPAATKREDPGPPLMSPAGIQGGTRSGALLPATAGEGEGRSAQVTPEARQVPEARAASALASQPAPSSVTDPSVRLVGAEVLAIRRKLHRQLIEQFDLRSGAANRGDPVAVRRQAEALMDKLLPDYLSQLPSNVEPAQLKKELLDEALGLGPLEDLLRDDSVTEIMVVARDLVFVERQGRISESRCEFSSDDALLAVIERIVTPLGRRIDESSPLVDARLKDGSRVNAVIPPLALKGPCLTIRKFSRKRLEMGDLIRLGALSDQMADLLERCVRAGKNIVISGGTGSGKTTLLNVLSSFIPETERVVTIEDAAELALQQRHVVSLETRPSNMEGRGAVSMRDLVRNALRMRPDRIVVGECRGGEALDMLQAMNTGHDGSLTTGHANAPEDMLARLETLVMMAGLELPLRAIRAQIVSAVDLIVQIRRFEDGSRRITHLTEVVEVDEDGSVHLEDIYRFVPEGVSPDGRIRGVHLITGYVPSFIEEMHTQGMVPSIGSF